MRIFNRSIAFGLLLVALGACSTTPKGEWLNFSQLETGLATNRSLACSPDICPNAKAQKDVLVFNASASAVSDAFRTIEPKAEFLTRPNGDIQARYVATTAVLQFRDDVDLLIHPVSANEAEVAVYSRSRIGLSDLGKNASRIDDLEQRIKKALADGA